MTKRNPLFRISLLFVSCLAMSMQVFAGKCTVQAGTIRQASGPIFVCSGDGLPDVVTITLTGNPGPNSRILFLDANGKIQDILTTLTIDFEGRPSNVYGVRQISYADGLQGLVVGGSVNSLNGCFALSTTGFTITVSNKKAGTLTTTTGDTTLSYCVADGQPDVPVLINSGNMAFGSEWVVTDLNDIVTSTSSNMPNFEGTGDGVVKLWLVTSCLEVVDVAVGSSIHSLPADMDHTNAITITKRSTGYCRPKPVMICNQETLACGKNVLMCINNVSTCVKSNKVNGYLKQGFALGGCIRCTTITSRMANFNDASIHEEQGLIIYPNPNNGSFTIANALKAKSVLELRNTLGQLIWSKTIETDMKENSQLNLQMISLPAGVYYFSVSDNENRQVKPIIIKN